MSSLLRVNLCLIVILGFITSTHSYLFNYLSENRIVNNKNEILKHRSTRNIQSDQSMTYRLPNNSHPIRYDLWMMTDIHKGDLKFHGRVKIHINIIEESETLTMHSRDIIIDKVDLYENSGILNKSNLDFEHYDEKEFITVLLPTFISAGKEIILDITYHGVMSNEMNGIYASFYENESFERVMMASTHFLPTNARRAFVCYDEPQIRAPIRLQIQHDNTYRVLSNMPMSKNDTLRETKYVITTFDETPPIPAYLLSFIVSNLDYISNKNSHIEQRIYGEPLKINNGTANFAIKIVEEVLDKFIEILPVQFVVSKIDHVGIPSMNGALEHLGLIAYEESFLLLDNNFNQEVLDFFKPQIIGMLSHSLAHQYFGGIVAPNWWQYLWLNEGFATFYQYLIPNLLYPEYKFMEIFQYEVTEYAFEIDIGTDTMSDYVETPLEIQKKFNSIVFEKSAAVIKMFYEALTPSTFTKGLVLFLDEMKFKAANSADFYRALQKAFDNDYPDENLNISNVMSTWEKQSGYPVISVERAGKNVILTQKRFSSDDENINAIYSIPITFATKSNPNFDKTTVNVWMTAQTLEINEILSTPNEWIILNIQQVGFYRVDYSQELWDAITNEYIRNFKIIHHTNRKVLHDEMFMAWKILKTKTACDCMKFLKVLEYEMSGSVWQRASQYLDPLNEFLMFSDIYPRFQDMMHKVLQPHVNALRVSKSVDKILSDEVIKWSKTTQHPTYLQRELDQLILYMETKESDDKPDFCSAFRHANISIYRHFIQEVINFEVIIDMQLISGLGCSLNKDHLNELFNEIMNPLNEVGQNIISSSIFSTIESSVIGLEVVMDLVNEKWYELNQLLPDIFEDLIAFMHTFINSQTHLEMFKNLTNRLIQSRVISTELTQSLLKDIEERLDEEDWKNIKVWFGLDEEQSSSTVTTSASQMETSTPSYAITLYSSIRIIAICISLFFLLKRSVI